MIAVVALVVSAQGGGASGPSRNALAIASHSAAPASPSMSHSPSATTRSESTTAQSPSATPAVAGKAAVRALIAAAPPGGVSVAVENLKSGDTFTAGSTSGMREASVAKVEILQTMLLQAGGPLTGTQDVNATAMIEHSDNNAANACFASLGGSAAYRQARSKLGLTDATALTQGYYWGLDTSSAMDQLVLLRNLVSHKSPLTPTARAYALKLMRSVESDQQWGVPAIADAGTTFAVKNGWLAFDDDNGLWGVNSDGIVTYHGQQLAISVMTQHSSDEQIGIDEVQKLAAKAAAVTAG